MDQVPAARAADRSVVRRRWRLPCGRCRPLFRTWSMRCGEDLGHRTALLRGGMAQGRRRQHCIIHGCKWVQGERHVAARIFPSPRGRRRRRGRATALADPQVKKFTGRLRGARKVEFIVPGKLVNIDGVMRRGQREYLFGLAHVRLRRAAVSNGRAVIRARRHGRPICR